MTEPRFILIFIVQGWRSGTSSRHVALRIIGQNVCPRCIQQGIWGHIHYHVHLDDVDT